MRRASPFSFGSTPSSMSKRIASAAEPLAFRMKCSRLPGTNIQERACFLVAPDMLLAPVKTARNEHPSPHSVNETFPEPAGWGSLGRRRAGFPGYKLRREHDPLHGRRAVTQSVEQ